MLALVISVFFRYWHWRIKIHLNLEILIFLLHGLQYLWRSLVRNSVFRVVLGLSSLKGPPTTTLFTLQSLDNLLRMSFKTLYSTPVLDTSHLDGWFHSLFQLDLDPRVFAFGCKVLAHKPFGWLVSFFISVGFGSDSLCIWMQSFSTPDSGHNQNLR